MTIEDYTRDDSPRYVYELWAADNTCLYVGVTARLGHRFNSHVRERDWWADVASVIVSVHPDKAAGEAAERERITELQPVHNRVFTDHNTSGRQSWETRRRNQRLRTAHSP